MKHTEQQYKLSSQEKRSSFILGSIFSFRLLGLFMVLPVLALYAQDLPGATPTLIGLSIGIYGLTQALLQLPFGMLSDIWGRKPLITIGLCLFALGSILAAVSHSITMVIIGRALQGAGAVGSTIIALMSDLTRESLRSKAMAIIGMMIGMSFALSMIMGPVLYQWVGVAGLFWLTAVLAIIGIALLFKAVPTVDNVKQAGWSWQQLKSVLKDPQLCRLDVGIFTLHGLLAASFVVIPIAFSDVADFSVDQLWKVYLPVLVSAFAFVFPLLRIAETKNCLKSFFLGAIALLIIAELWLSFMHSSTVSIAIGLWLFFLGFSFLEANLPSLISRMAPKTHKGTAIGVYSTAQFLGIFCGGIAGGWLYGLGHIGFVFMGCALFASLWWWLAKSMIAPAKQKIESNSEQPIAT